MGLSADVQALLVALCGGVVAALYKFSQERKQEGSTYDIIDFILLSISGSFAGFIGYCVARWQLEDPFIIIALTGIASTGGYAMLDFFKESMIEAVRRKLGVPQQVHVPLPPQMYQDVHIPGIAPERSSEAVSPQTYSNPAGSSQRGYTDHYRPPEHYPTQETRG